MDSEPDLLTQAWNAVVTFNEDYPGALNAARRGASWLRPTVIRWTAPARRYCRASLATDVADARSWSPRRQTMTALLVAFMAGPVAYFTLSHATGSVPPFVEAWTVAVAAATSAYGLWVIARRGWKADL